MIKLGLFWTFESENDGQVLQNSIAGCKIRKVLFGAYMLINSIPDYEIGFMFLVIV